jgi:hypothetical protein
MCCMVVACLCAIVGLEHLIREREKSRQNEEVGVCGEWQMAM